VYVFLDISVSFLSLFYSDFSSPFLFPFSSFYFDFSFFLLISVLFFISLLPLFVNTFHLVNFCSTHFL
jgi:hypothetical protein